jgi:hypothetical protein
MARPANTQEIPVSADVETPLNTENLPTKLTVEDLLSIILKGQNQQADANKALADAIIYLGTPKEPIKSAREIAQESNAKLEQENSRLLRLREKANIKYSQEQCSHIAGNRGDLPDVYQRTSIAWHHGDVGQVFGICTGCNRIFYEDDPDFAVWRKRPSFSRVDSAAGFRTVFDPVAARRAARLKDS